MFSTALATERQVNFEIVSESTKFVDSEITLETCAECGGDIEGVKDERSFKECAMCDDCAEREDRYWKNHYASIVESFL